MKRKIKLFAVMTSCMMFLASCSGWLDVKPYDKISEDELLLTESGFQKLLNGIYVELNVDDLYGKALTVEMIEVMGGAYNIGNESEKWKDYIDLNGHKYTSPIWRGRLSATWDKAYSLILNCNKIIDNIDAKKELFAGDNLAIIKGEATAIRAMLHFDMLRIFGPVYSKYPENKSIPYYTTTSTTIGDLLPASTVIEKVLADLSSAEILLAKDPIIKNGTMMSSVSGESNFLRYRAIRFNYYAIQGLTARVALYAGNKSKAFEYAQKVIAASESGIFPFVKQFDIQATKNPDRVFSSEVLFALTNVNRNRLFKEIHDPAQAPNAVFTMNNDLVTKLIFGGTAGGGAVSDYRYIANWSNSTNTALTGMCFYKYADMEEVTDIRNTMIPMLRIGEMYLIAAEAQSEDLNGGLAYVNKLRGGRGGVTPLTSLTPALLNYEYVRELYGEGQLFYFYKRTFSNILTGYKSNKPVTKVASDAIFTVPMPDSEMNNR